MADEILNFDGLSLNDSIGGTWVMAEFNCPPPKKRMDWVTSDTHGSTLVREPLYENRVITVRLETRVQQASMDAALDAIAALVDKVEECSRHQDGLPLAWSPANSARTVYFDVLAGEITELPVTIDSGWLNRAPSLTLELTCKPFWRGTLVTSAEIGTAGAPYVAPFVSNPYGDAPADATLIVTETSNVARNDVEWGLEHRYYGVYSPNTLLLDSSSYTLNGIGTSSTRTGNYNSGVVHSTLLPIVARICSFGDQPHIGTFRVKARVWCDKSTVFARLAWRDGDGPLFNNQWAAPQGTSNFCELDLGTITIGEAEVGTQRWTGQIEAYSTLLNSAQLDIDYVMLIPAGEAYGRATSSLKTDRTLLIAQDSFDQSSGNLAGKSLNLGGTWAAPGSPIDTDDFQVSTALGNIIVRGAASDSGNWNQGRIVLAGTTVLTGTEAQLDFQGDPAWNGVGIFGIVLRYVDTSNFAVAYCSVIANTALPDPWVNAQVFMGVTKVIAGTATAIGDPVLVTPFKQWGTLHVWVDDSGRVLLIRSLQIDNNLAATSFGQRYVYTAQDSTLASGGTLDDGKVGIYDRNSGALGNVRAYDNFFAYNFERQSVLNPTRTLRIGSDDVLRENSSGYYGRPPAYQGARFRLPPDGDQGRLSRVFVKARRNVTTEFPDDHITDNVNVRVEYTPRGIVVPR